MNYSTGEQNIITPEFQMIRLSEGYCPHNCDWCYEGKLSIPFQDYKLPEIVRRDVRITDMNILASDNPEEKIRQFQDIKVDGKCVYPKLICGIDYRYLTFELAILLHDSKFYDLHFAWDKGFNQQKIIKKALSYLLKAGYRTNQLSIFMICNHKSISYEECIRKLDLCKYWNIKVNDCWYDNQLPPNIEPIGWTLEQCKSFRKQVRKHNQICNFKIDPEFKEKK